MFSQQGRFLLVLMALICSLIGDAQTVWYPRNSSDLLKSTASDLSANLSKAIPGAVFSVQEYQTIPASGIIFIYDSSITANDACRVESNGSSFIKFTARQDNGLNIGVYRYLADLGFRFYLPGTIWETTPSLTSAYKLINTTVKTGIKYNSWFISGGCSKWIMDNDASYSWEIYSGKNGHAWAQYQRRNLMTGAYRFTGHRGDIYTPAYLQQLQSDPCLVASHDGERLANVQAVPDINNPAAKDLWANEIEKKYKNYKATITGNPAAYANTYRNFDFSNTLLGLEVGDGSRFGNSTSSLPCNTGNWNGQPYPSESDQQFLLVNSSATKIGTTLTDKRFQAYAYDGHSNVPSTSVAIDPRIDVQVISTAFQLESSSKGLLNRWYSRHGNISEYIYVNIPQWAGETPVSSATELKQTIKRIKDKNAQGLVIEASPAKFSSLPLLFSANRYLLDNVDMDSSRAEFTRNMFGTNAGIYINQLLSHWENEQVFTVGDFIKDNKYKLPLYIQTLKSAENAAISANAPAIVLQRIRELKAYLHYLVLYYDIIADNNTITNKTGKVETLCLYLAKTADLQVVNSYYLIQDLLNKFPATHSIRDKFNIQTGTAYQGGQLPKITAAEIDQLFQDDVNGIGQLVNEYKIEKLETIMQQMENSDIEPLQKIDVKIQYTNGKDYPNRTEFYIYAKAASSFKVNCTPEFNMPGKGFINITAEAVDNPLLILNDVTITRDNLLSNIQVNIPAKGFYKLTILSKYKTTNLLSIETNGNVFFRNGPFYGNMVEYYKLDYSKLPRFVNVPAGVSKIYFSVNNACNANGTCISVSDVQSAFSFRDAKGNIPALQVSPDDKSLFYLEVPQGGAGFWQVNTMREYDLCFANIANAEIYAQTKKCVAADFTIKLIKKGDDCYTRMHAPNANPLAVKWEIWDGNRWTFYSGMNLLDVKLLSPYAIVTLRNGNGCSYTLRTGSLTSYMRDLVYCSSSGPIPTVTEGELNVYPNPSAGKFTITISGVDADFEQISVYDAQGKQVLTAKNASAVDITSLPAGIYFYRGKKGIKYLHGKLVKL